jgi:hypothetical protein
MVKVKFITNGNEIMHAEVRLVEDLIRLRFKELLTRQGSYKEELSSEWQVIMKVFENKRSNLIANITIGISLKMCPNCSKLFLILEELLPNFKLNLPKTHSSEKSNERWVFPSLLAELFGPILKKKFDSL